MELQKFGDKWGVCKRKLAKGGTEDDSPRATTAV